MDPGRDVLAATDAAQARRFDQPGNSLAAQLLAHEPEVGVDSRRAIGALRGTVMLPNLQAQLGIIEVSLRQTALD
jgi:hypothetical protein